MAIARRPLPVLVLLLSAALLQAAQSGPAGFAAPAPAGTAPAPTGAGTAGSGTAPAPAAHVLLWQAVRGDSTVYLLGSVHIAQAGIYPLNDYIEAAFSRASRLVVEVDVSKVDQAVLQKKVMERGMLPAGRSLRTELSSDAARKLEEKLEAHGLPASGFDRMQPWLAYLVLSELDLSLMGYAAAQGVDLHFLSRAGDREVVELETADFQLDLLSGFTDEDQRELLTEYLDETGLEEETLELFDAWYAGDEEQLSALITEELEGSGVNARIEQELLRKRDAAMAVKIGELLQKPGVSFVVIGAAHLVGTGSVVDLLRAGGVDVTEVGSPAP